ncbi:MAG: DUF167 domain-containing protein [Candidatus Villigracilaceae bacterium]
MSPRKYRLHDGKRGAAIAVRITPRASQNQVVEILEDGTVRIHLVASPTEDDVNVELVSYLSQILAVPKSHIEVVAGETSFDKIVSVLDMTAQTLQKRIVAHLD